MDTDDEKKRMTSGVSDEFERLIERLSNEHDENVKRLTRIEGALSHLDECLDDLKRKLFGNGQPGVLSVLEKRVLDLENLVWLVKGGWKFLLGGVSLCVAIIEIILAFLRHK